jgi:hypothetical protein
MEPASAIGIVGVVHDRSCNFRDLRSGATHADPRRSGVTTANIVIKMTNCHSEEPAEGSRETIERELNRETASKSYPPSPGDTAKPGTPGTGEDVCETCHGTGKADGASCPACDGTGRVVRGIGGG